MPELPEVETMVRGTQAALLGRRLLRMQFLPCRRKPLSVDPAPGPLTRKLRNTTVTDVGRLGKRIVMTFDDRRFLIIEPRMTGLLLVADPPTAEHRRIRWILEPQSGLPDSIEYWDRRGLGTIRLLDEDGIRQLRERLGPDPLTMTAIDWKRQLAGSRRAIKVALLDQSLAAGIGNLYASEILHRARISPNATAGSLSRTRLERLADCCQAILTDAIRFEGSTLSDRTYRNVLNQDGGYQNHHRVYQKDGEPCASCRRSLIRKIVQAQRSTFYCPACQRR